MSRGISFIIISCLIFLLLVALGTWQLYRLNWKQNILLDIETKLTEEPIHNQALALSRDISNLQYRKVKLQGKFLYNHVLYMYAGNKSPIGKPGYFIIMPFEFNPGQYILVNRGFIEEKYKHTEFDIKNLNNNAQMIEGLLIPETPKPYFMPSNDLKNNMWFWLDLHEIKTFLNLNLINNLILLQYNANNPDMINNEFSTHDIRNDHLYYAITWYSMAIAVLILFAYTKFTKYMV